MFDNIGGKLKGLAKVLCVLGIIASVIGAIVVWVSAGKLGSYSRYSSEASTLTVYGFIILIGGCLSAWVSSWALYGIGEAADARQDVQLLRDEVRALKKQLPQAQGDASAPAKPAVKVSNSSMNLHSVSSGSNASRVCRACGYRNVSTAQFCKDCGKDL